MIIFYDSRGPNRVPKTPEKTCLKCTPSDRQMYPQVGNSSAVASRLARKGFLFDCQLWNFRLASSRQMANFADRFLRLNNVSISILRLT